MVSIESEGTVCPDSGEPVKMIHHSPCPPFIDRPDFLLNCIEFLALRNRSTFFACKEERLAFSAPSRSRKAPIMNSKSRSLLALLIVTCLLAVLVSAFGWKG